MSVIETSDDNFIGIYDVTILSEFDQPFVDGSTTTVSETIEFQLVVNPCSIDSFDPVSPPIRPVEYTLGDVGFSFGYYEFE